MRSVIMCTRIYLVTVIVRRRLSHRESHIFIFDPAIVSLTARTSVRPIYGSTCPLGLLLNVFNVYEAMSLSPLHEI